MATATAIPVITITRILNASRERVFAAWTDPTQMHQWFAPSSAFDVTFDVTIEAGTHLGSSYKLQMFNRKAGTTHTAVGKYIEFVPPEKLVFTWDRHIGACNQDTDPAEDTIVSVELRDLGGKTELTLTHALVSDAASRASHTQGWTGCINRLAHLFDPNAEQLPIPAPRPIWQVE